MPPDDEVPSYALPQAEAETGADDGWTGDLWTSVMLRWLPTPEDAPGSVIDADVPPALPPEAGFAWWLLG
jgi:hypothetical protein